LLLLSSSCCLVVVANKFNTITTSFLAAHIIFTNTRTSTKKTNNSKFSLRLYCWRCRIHL
jgi:hypothetical protein